MAKYLLTGVAGFIGSKVCEFLLEENATVIGLDNLNEAYDTRLKTWRLDQLVDRKGFEFANLDIRDGSALDAFLDSCSDGPFAAIINLAACAGVRQSVENPRIYYETNVLGTLNLLDLCRKFDIKKFVLASTSSLYGAKNIRPYREDSNTDHPLSPYAASKKAAEALCYSYHYLYDLDVSVLRYFTVYGPAGRPDMSVFRFIQWISEQHPTLVYGDGSQSRDFTFVEDIASGTVAALEPMGFEIINLGSDEPVALLDVIRLVEELTGREAKLVFEPKHPADVLATWADITKAKTLLNWRPRTPFRDGVARTVEWYQENRSWARDVQTR